MMSKRRRRLGRWVGGSVLALLLLSVVLLNGCSGLLARSILWGPNTDKPINPADDPSNEALARLGVNRQLRVDVGPPAASLSLWVVDPPASSRPAPRGTVLVLHGINDRKDSMLGLGKQIAAHGYRSVLVDLRAH